MVGESSRAAPATPSELVLGVRRRHGPEDEVLQSVVDHARRVKEAVEGRTGDQEALRVGADAVPLLDRALDEGWLAAGPDATHEAVRGVGCFVGQVLCEELGGVWAEDPDRGLHVRLGEELHVNPFGWVHDRLTRREKPLVERWRDVERALGML